MGQEHGRIFYLLKLVLPTSDSTLNMELHLILSVTYILYYGILSCQLQYVPLDKRLFPNAFFTVSMYEDKHVCLIPFILSVPLFNVTITLVALAYVVKKLPIAISQYRSLNTQPLQNDFIYYFIMLTLTLSMYIPNMT